MKKYVSYTEYEEMIDKLSVWVKHQSGQWDNIGAVYGLPRGGLPIAVELSHRLNLPLLMNYYDRKVVTNKKILVVDDIADTGHTLKDFENPHNIICTLHYHEDSLVLPDYYVELKGDDWIVYPWEEKDSEEIPDYKVDPTSEKVTYVYESPDGGETVYKRANGSNERILVKSPHDDPNQLNLFEDKLFV